MKIKAVPSTWLERNGRRLDCGPYLSGGIEAREILSRHSTMPLSDVTLGHDEGIFNGPRFPRTYVDNSLHGVPFLGSTDVLQADFSYVPLLSKKQVDATPGLLIDAGWILITCSGTIGRLCYSRSVMKGMAGSQHFMRVVPNWDEIKPGYLYAYLSSRFGIPLLISGTYGAIIQHIEPHHISDLPVPRLGAVEENAQSLVEQAADLLAHYQNNVREATQLFFESVGFQDISAAEWHNWGSDLGFTTTIEGPESLRALNFNPRFKKLCEKMKQGPWKPLDSICVPGTLKRASGRYSRIDADPEFSYRLIGQKQVFWIRPEGRWVARRFLGDGFLVPDQTTLVAAQGTLAENELFCRAEFITGQALESAYSEHFLRVIAHESVFLPGSLFAFMRSETAFRMLRSISMGTKLQDHHRSMLPDLPIPYPPEAVRQKTHELIVDAYKAREQAVILEDEAKILVERAIEEGGR